LDLETVDGLNLLVYASGAFNELTGLLSGLAEAVHTALSIATLPLLAVLAVGTLLDLIIAAAVLSAVRLSRRA
jgi:hypothetical protein